MEARRARRTGAAGQVPVRVDRSSFGRRWRKKRRGRAYSHDSGTRGGRGAASCRPSAQAALQYQTPPIFCDARPRLLRQTGQDPPPFETQVSIAGHKVSDAGAIGKRRGGSMDRHRGHRRGGSIDRH
jgi:hypothetical protein